MLDFIRRINSTIWLSGLAIGIYLAVVGINPAPAFGVAVLFFIANIIVWVWE